MSNYRCISIQPGTFEMGNSIFFLFFPPPPLGDLVIMVSLFSFSAVMGIMFSLSFLVIVLKGFYLCVHILRACFQTYVSWGYFPGAFH